MRQDGLVGVVGGRTQHSRARQWPWPPERMISSAGFTAPRRAFWAYDSTYSGTRNGWACLVVILDGCGRRIVSWRFASHVRESLVDAA